MLTNTHAGDTIIIQQIHFCGIEWYNLCCCEIAEREGIFAVDNYEQSIFVKRKSALKFLFLSIPGFAIFLFGQFCLLDQIDVLKMVALIYGIVCVIIYIVKSRMHWKCPHCQGHYPVLWHPIEENNLSYCPYCGKEL